MKLYYEKKEKQLKDQVDFFLFFNFEIFLTNFFSKADQIDKKLMKLFEAYRITSQKLTDVTREKEDLEKKYLEQQFQMNTTKEDLETIRSNYEQQMTVLAEHMSRLNENLASQSEEIEELKATKLCLKCKKPLSKK